MYKNLLKPFFDFVIAFLLIILLSPLILLLILLLLISNKGDFLFTQKRPGKNEKIFRLYKFKTMTDDVDENGVLLPDESRLTNIGKIIRKFSLDELLQLINVLKGDMSLIGPRPLLIEYLPLYSKFQKKRHNVRPGITGWAQVNGRQFMPYSKRFEYDIFYVHNISLKLDLKIIYLTIIKIIKSEGVKNCQSTEEVDDLGFWNKKDK